MITKNFGSCIGSKFTTDGTFRPFAGNTIISFLEGQPIHAELVKLQDALLSGGRSQYLIPLPPRSFHMTVFEGVCDQVRDYDHWSSLVPRNASLEMVTARLYQEFLGIPDFPSISAQIVGLRIDGAVSIHVEPCSKQDEQALYDYRDACSQALGINFPNQGSYMFHIGLAYGRKPADEDDVEFYLFQQQAAKILRENPIRFVVPPPAFCIFDDMSQFQLYKR